MKKTNILFCKATDRDTLFQKPFGLPVRYYEDGKIQDSVHYNNDGSKRELFHYYQDGKTWAHRKQQGKSKVCKGFHEKGNLNEDFIYSKEAEFTGGNAEWSACLSNALCKFNPGKRGASVGTYKAVVKFIADENGSIINIEAETNYGYGIEDKAIEIIKKSPKWTPAIIVNKKVKAYRRQSLTLYCSGGVTQYIW